MVTEGDEAGRRSRLTSKSGFRTGVKVSLGLAEHVRGGQRSREVGVGPEGSPGVGAGALRRPEDPTRRACARRPPGCWTTSAAGAVRSDG